MASRMRDAATRAGARIMDIYRKGVDVSRKADRTPVTAADREAEEIILGHLNPFGLPVLSEEREAECAGKPHDPESLGTRFFVVDPLDGTREFVSGNGQFTVNIALIAHGRPILGVVLEPVTGKLFEGSPAGAFVSRVDGQAPAGRSALATNPAAPLRFVA
ncbi:MAG TPA: 3'(2'),5'-bisphosphate nucleotidase CysQ, partial [Devosia sp.]|nr:3'(2'),5'-bisphosphate nucleotidase CysQ [Devosia sp.]